jgi:hypothetical protein
MSGEYLVLATLLGFLIGEIVWGTVFVIGLFLGWWEHLCSYILDKQK